MQKQPLLRNKVEFSGSATSANWESLRDAPRSPVALISDEDFQALPESFVALHSPHERFEPKHLPIRTRWTGDWVPSWRIQDFNQVRGIAVSQDGSSDHRLRVGLFDGGFRAEQRATADGRRAAISVKGVEWLHVAPRWFRGRSTASHSGSVGPRDCDRIRAARKKSLL